MTAATPSTLTRGGTAPPAAPARLRRSPVALGTIGRILILAIAAFLTLGPVIWMLWTSLTPQPAGGGQGELGLAAYRDVFHQARMALLIWNGALVTGLVAIGQMLTAAVAGYVFARMEF